MSKFRCCGASLNRRAVLGGIAGVTVAGISPVRALAQDAATMPPQPGDYLVRATGDDLTPLTPADIETGARAIQAWPAATDGDIVRDGTLFNLLIVSRWDFATLGAEAREYAAEGVVAQSTRPG